MQDKPKPDPIREAAKIIEASAEQWQVPVPTRPRVTLRQSDAGGLFVRDAEGRTVAYVAGGTK